MTAVTERHRAKENAVQVDQLTPRCASYCGNRSVAGLERALPTDRLSSHDFCDDEVEVYALGDAVVLLPNRAPNHTFSPEFFRQLTVGWGPVRWWTLR